MSKVLCNICCNDAPPSKIVSCKFCQESVCNTCVKTYLLDSHQDPHCMFCKKEWQRDYLYSFLSKSFVNVELKKQREVILLDREKALLPATQPAAERYIKVQNQEKLIRNFLNEKSKLLEQIKQLDQTISIARINLFRISNGSDLQQSSTSNAFHRKCPNNDCRGFLNSNLSCGICKSNVCKDCNGILKPDEAHTCDPSEKANFQLIKSETKPCPSCATNIYKISGCDQMFCTNCQTAFSWRRGTIETRNIHNPHYFEWMRQGGDAILNRAHGDFECGGVPLANYLVACDNYRKKRNLTDFRRLVVHIQQVELEKYHIPTILSNEDLRIKYIVNEITEADLKRQLQLREKKRFKHKEYYQIFSMVSDTLSEYLRQIHAILEQHSSIVPGESKQQLYFGRYRTVQTNTLNQLADTVSDDIRKRIDAMQQVCKYANEQFHSTGKTLNCKSPLIQNFNQVV